MWRAEFAEVTKLDNTIQYNTIINNTIQYYTYTYIQVGRLKRASAYPTRQTNVYTTYYTSYYTTYGTTYDTQYTTTYYTT